MTTAERIKHAEFLLSLQHKSKVARRLGMTEDALDQMLEGSRDAQSDPAGGQSPGGGA